MGLLTRLLALVHIIVGVIGSVIAVPFIGIWMANEPGGNAGYQADGLTFIPLFVVYFAPSVICGLGLLFGQAWARKALLVQSVAYLFVWPEGTALAAATLALLLPHYLAGRPAISVGNIAPASAASAATPANARLRVLVTMALAIATVLSAMDIILTLLFRYNEDYVPRGLEQAFVPSLFVFPIAGLLLMRFAKLPVITLRPRPLLPRTRWGHNQALARFTREELARVARLEADPATYKYGQMIRAGQQWRDETIAYDRDPTALATCVHLQPVERAMRQAGVHMRLAFDTLYADCCVEPVALGRMFDLSGPASYLTIPGDRPYDPRGATLFCREHPKLRCFTVHLDEARAETPWFPSPPQPGGDGRNLSNEEI